MGGRLAPSRIFEQTVAIARDPLFQGDSGSSQALQTTTNTDASTAAGSTIGSEGATIGAKEEEDKRKGVSKKKLGAGGLQIPMQTNASKTAAPTTGVQI